MANITAKHSAKPPASRKNARAPVAGPVRKRRVDPAALDVALTRIGTRLRHARLTRGVRMKDVAEAAGCSESLVSKIENNKIQPSLHVLHRICAVMKMGLGELFSASHDEDDVVMRAGHRVMIELDGLRRGQGIKMERLIPSAKGRLLQGNIHIVAPGGSSDGMISHDGDEVGYVIIGEIELVISGKAYRLGPGDSFNFRSDLPHGYRNVGSGEARIIWVNTPPSF